MRTPHTSRIVRGSAALALVSCLALTAYSCASTPPSATGSGASTAPLLPPETPTQGATESNPEPSGEAVTEIPIRIRIDDQTLDARLWNNPAARSLIEQLPLTLDFSDYGRQELLATPPHPLTMEGMPSGESAPAGTIGWYAPGGVIVLYYTDVGHYNGIVRIGQMDGDLSILTGWSEARTVSIEQAT